MIGLFLWLQLTLVLSGKKKIFLVDHSHYKGINFIENRKANDDMKSLNLLDAKSFTSLNFKNTIRNYIFVSSLSTTNDQPFPKGNFSHSNLMNSCHEFKFKFITLNKLVKIQEKPLKPNPHSLTCILWIMNCLRSYQFEVRTEYQFFFRLSHFVKHDMWILIRNRRYNTVVGRLWYS